MSEAAYAYYPGCSLHHGLAREYDVSTRRVCQALGIDLVEMEGWTCCGASSAHLTDRLLGIALPSRNLKLAQGMGLPMAISCALCFSRHKFACYELGDAATREQVNRALGDVVAGEVEVWHLLQVLDRRELPVRQPLAGLKVACYYGCLLARPAEVTHFDDEENPQIMDRLLASLGAQPLDWGLKVGCCGAGMPLARPDMVYRLSHRILSLAKREGAECLAVACPMCHNNLDTYQRDIESKYGERLGLPIIYFTQLVGLALGLSPKELRLDKHLVDPMPLLRSKGLA